MTEFLLSTACQAMNQIHDSALRCRALMQIAQLERAAGLDPQATLTCAERLLRDFTEPTAQAVNAGELAQCAWRLGHDPYRFLDRARSASVGGSILGEIYVALIEAKLGDHPERKLRWAEQCASIQQPASCLLQTQAAIARIQSDGGDWNAAQATIRRIENPLQRMLSYCELTITAHQRGHERMAGAMPSIDAISCLCDQVRAKCALAMTAQAIGIDATEFLRQSIDLAGQLRTPENRQVAAVLFTRVLAHRQDFGIALQIVKALPDHAQPEALLAACDETAEQGDVAMTRALAQQLLVPGYRDRALYCIVRSAVRAVGGVIPESCALFRTSQL